MRNVWIIAKRDLRAQFNSPVAYVVLGGTMLLLGVLMFVLPHMAVAGVSIGGFWEIDRAKLDEMFTCLPPLMSIFVIPALTIALSIVVWCLIRKVEGHGLRSAPP